MLTPEATGPGPSQDTHLTTTNRRRASSPQQCTYTCTPQTPAFLVILLTRYRIHRRNRCAPPGGMSIPTLPHCRHLPFLGILFASGRIHRRGQSSGSSSGTGAHPQGTKCADTSKLRENRQPKRQDSPQELPGSVLTLHSPRPQGSRAGTPTGAGLRLPQAGPTRKERPRRQPGKL
jgi:hypothetical protein